MQQVRAYVGIGANLGDARASVQQAIHALDQLAQTRVAQASSLYSTAPVVSTQTGPIGPDAGPDYINAVAELRSTLSPLELLHQLQALELAHGRQRPFHHAPRTLDLDLLLMGCRQFASAELTLPHPRLHQRAFVLLPLLELAPDLVHPTLGALQQYLPTVAHQSIEKLP